MGRDGKADSRWLVSLCFRCEAPTSCCKKLLRLNSFYGVDRWYTIQKRRESRLKCCGDCLVATLDQAGYTHDQIKQLAAEAARVFTTTEAKGEVISANPEAIKTYFSETGSRTEVLVVLRFAP